jgi:hypothetical protein
MIEVLKQALEALEDVGVLTDREWQAVHKNKANELRQAIAELESQKPVAWRIKVETKLRDGSVDVGYQLRNEKFSVYDEPLYTHSPQRTWAGLTDDEVNTLWGEWKDAVCLDHKTWAKAIEAKLKEKNCL